MKIPSITKSQNPFRLSVGGLLRRTLLYMLTLSLFCSNGYAEDRMSEAFDLIDRIVSNDIENGFPSAQIAVMQNGEFLYENAWGSGITKDTLFDLASNTKAYSVVFAVQYLASRGLLDLDTPIIALASDAFADDTLDLAYCAMDAERADLNTQKSWKRSITVRDVLCHRAGLPVEASFLLRSDFVFDGADTNPLFVGCDASAETRSKVLDALCKMPLYYEPRTRVLYSDTDYVLMSLLIEKLTGKGMQEFLRESFWEPLELNHITYTPLEYGFTKKDCAPTELHGNTRDGVVWFDGIRTEMIQGQAHDETAYYAMAGVSGNAGLFSNAHDLAILANTMIDSDPFFTDAVIREFTSAASDAHDEWGVGWYRQGQIKRAKYFSTLSGENTIGHQGWTGTLTLIDREQKLVIVLLTSKRNTKVTDPSVDPNNFDGNYYTTAKLGFASQLIYDALNGKDLEATLQTLVDTMRTQYESDPCQASANALASIEKTQRDWLQSR